MSDNGFNTRAPRTPYQPQDWLEWPEPPRPPLWRRAWDRTQLARMLGGATVLAVVMAFLAVAGRALVVFLLAPRILDGWDPSFWQSVALVVFVDALVNWGKS